MTSKLRAIWHILRGHPCTFRHDCQRYGSSRITELEGIVDNLHLELRARKLALAQRLRPFVTWEELHDELQHIQEEEE